MMDALYERVVAAVGHQYELESEIGRGGMSVVYRARDLRLNRLIAIKVLPPELAYDPAIRTRFTREAMTSAHLAHAHIVPIHDVGERDGVAYLVMSLITGGNLADLLAREPRQPLDEVRRILCQVADALAYAHLHGVIHRDIKPDNILLERESGRALVTDFGIARAMEANTRLTLTGIAVGTPTYMSPEQAMGEREVDGRSDIYSLGVLGYQMLTGRVPFAAGNSMAMLLKHVAESARPIAELRPETPRVLREAIERALMKAPEDRWPTAAAMRDALASNESPSAWRIEQREPVRYTLPRPDGTRPDPRPVSPKRGTPAAEVRGGATADRVRNSIVLEPEHLAPLTPAQRDDLRLWHGRVHLMDRISAMRGYTLLTIATTFASLGGVVFAIESGAVPLVLAPLVPAFMAIKLGRRGRSLRENGLRLRRVLLMPRASWVLPAPTPPPTERQLEKLAPREILDSPHGAAIRLAVNERASIFGVVGALPKADRALLPDVKPTVDALVERVVDLARTLHRLEQSFDPRAIAELDARIAEGESETESSDGQRRAALLLRQRGTLADLVQRRATLARQLESAGLALGNIRLDLIKVRSSGIQAGFADISTATQEARALSRDIDVVLDAAAELKHL